jgi:hypothetical protein
MSPNVVNSFGIYPWNFPTGKSTISHPLSVFHDVFTLTVLRSYCSFSSCVRYQVQPRSSRGRVAARRPSMDSCHITGDLLCCCSSSHSCAKLAVMSSSCLHHFLSSELLSKFTQQEMLEGRTYRCENCCGEFQWTCCLSCEATGIFSLNQCFFLCNEASSPDSLQFAQKRLQIAELPEVATTLHWWKPSETISWISVYSFADP